MKRSVLYSGIVYVLIGGCCIAVALLTETRPEPLLWGFCGAMTGPGIAMIWKYFYWSRPAHQEAYAERLRVERIEMGDERKTMLRDKSGRITNTVMLYMHCALTLVISVLTTLGHLPGFGRAATLTLVALMVFQVTCGVVVFNRLSERM